MDQFANLVREKRILNNIAQYIYLNILPNIGEILEDKRKERRVITNDELLSAPKVAFVCDEMTWLDFSKCGQGIFLSPVRWRKQLDDFRPDLFFCESTWSGDIQGWPDWRGRVYRNHELWFENRRSLLELLEYCDDHGIATVFWNKEDPAFWGSSRYDFVDTAMRFDCIFTTAEECIEKYKDLGHQRIYLLPFGVNTRLFYPRPEEKKHNTVIFAGSWFDDFPQRCNAMTVLFDYILEQGLQLEIYDRKSEIGGKKFSFPSRYQPYLHECVPYQELPSLLARYEYALNVNTVTDSGTMCSRRVLQLAACGMKIISNPSQAMEHIEGLHLYRSEGKGQILFWESDAQAVAQHYNSDRQFQLMLRQAVGALAATK